MSVKTPQETVATLIASVESVLKGQHETVSKIVAAFISGGHVLLEDYPGTGKTTLAKALALSIEGAQCKRLQFTPDLLPSDILGVSIWDVKESTFVFHPGPVFAHILLADEINRASPRAQSALLEVMAESQATIEGVCHSMPQPFFVLATQNPVEFRGTYPLPEAQLDRFSMQLSLGYLSAEDEISLLEERQDHDPLDDIQARLSIADIENAQKVSRAVTVSTELKKYMVDLVRCTRSCEGVLLPASPRASLTLMRISQTLAMAAGRTYIIPEDIRRIAADVIAHRIVLDPQRQYAASSKRSFVETLLHDIPAPL